LARNHARAIDKEKERLGAKPVMACLLALDHAVLD